MDCYWLEFVPKVAFIAFKDILALNAVVYASGTDCSVEVETRFTWGIKLTVLFLIQDLIFIATFACAFVVDYLVVFTTAFDALICFRIVGGGFVLADASLMVEGLV